MALDPESVMRLRLDLVADAAELSVLRAFRGLRPSVFADDWAARVDDVAAAYLQAQAGSLTTAGQYLSDVAGSMVRPDPLDFVGSVGGRTLAEHLAVTPGAFDARVAAGMTRTQAAVASVEYLSASASAEVHIVGRDAVASTADSDPRFTAYARVPEPGACEWCRMLATRGAVYSRDTVTSTRNRMPYHTKRPNGSGGVCRCTARAMPAGSGASDWKPARPAAATAGQIREQAARFKVGSGTPERLAEVRRLLGVYRRLQDAGRGYASLPGQIAALTDELAKAGLAV